MRVGLLIGMMNAGAGGPFEPTDISDCTLWLDAADTATISSSGSTVTGWADKSASNYDMVAPGGAPDTGTRTVNSLNALDFVAASTEYLQYSSTSSVNNASDGSWTVFAVVVADVLSSYASVLDKDQSPSRVGQFIRTNPSGAVESIGFTNASAPAVDAGPTLTTGTTRLLMSVNTGTSVEAFVNGTGNGSTGLANQRYATGSLLRVGASGGGVGSGVFGPWDGAICEIIMYSRDLTSGEIDDVETYLADKWGITL